MRYILILFFLTIIAPLPVLADNRQDAIAFALNKNWSEAQSSAQQSGNISLKTLVEWLYVQDIDSGASFDEISQFINQHPNWPDANKILTRAEHAMRNTSIADGDILAWFEVNPPISGVGKWTYAEVLRRNKQKTSKIPNLVKEAWKDADLSEADENSLLTEFGDLLSVEDHRARIDRLLWEEKTTSARHLIGRLPVAEQVAAQARIALIKDEKNAPFLVKQVTGKFATDPGLLFERLRFRARKDDKDGMREILLMTPKDVPYPEKWWKYRGVEVRRAVAEQNYGLAARLLANHGQVSAAALSDALWLDGWIKLEFAGNAKAGYEAFYRMFDTVKYPVSKSRAAYWAARAAKKMNDANTAKEWFKTASQYVTTFYGQLALAELSSSPTLSLPDEPSLAFYESDEGLPEDLKQTIALCIQMNELKLASRLIDYVIENIKNEHATLTVAQLGHELNAPHISVKAAKKAQNQGVILKNVGYPRLDTDKSWPIERALTLAITRQESEFNPQAVSPSGALGLMQLLPGTAKETAKKNDLDYDKEKLFTPEYNMQLGSLYLGRMVNAYDGSYIKAIAAYNAGPGNVQKWLKQFGSPNNNLYEAINWMEKIPFTETRNYVQRVLENVQVYRALEGNSKLAIADDITR